MMFTRTGYSFFLCVAASFLSSCSLNDIVKGVHYERQGDYESAIKEWDAAIAINPKSVISYYHRAYDRGKLGDYKNAIIDASKVIELCRDYPAKKHISSKAYALRANADIQLKQYRAAVEDSNRSIDLAPNFGTPYYFRSKAYSFLGHKDLAAKDIAKAEQLGYSSDPDKSIAK